jgi:multidrug efflux pump subunit AcrB
MLEGIVRRGTLLTIVVLVVCVFGVIAVMRVPVQMIPDLEVRTISVRTSWPGATPQDVEKEILVEQEEFLRAVPNTQRMISTASTGRARIELEFPFGVDINDALIRVSNALSQVPSYPENVNEPRIYASSFSENSFMYFRVGTLPDNPRGLDIDMMRDFVEDNVRTRMERVPGVSEVRVYGGAERQVQILVDPARLAERDLTLTDVRRAIVGRNRDVSGGDVNSGKRRYLLRTVGRFDSVEELEDLVLARRGDALIRLGDVASVRLDHYEIRARGFSNGEPPGRARAGGYAHAAYRRRRRLRGGFHPQRLAEPRHRCCIRLAGDVSVSAVGANDTGRYRRGSHLHHCRFPRAFACRAHHQRHFAGGRCIRHRHDAG